MVPTPSQGPSAYVLTHL